MAHVAIDRRSHQWCSIKKCSLKFHNIHRKTFVLESLFTNVAGLKAFKILKGNEERRWGKGKDSLNLKKRFHDGSLYHKETSRLICRAN